MLKTFKYYYALYNIIVMSGYKYDEDLHHINKIQFMRSLTMTFVDYSSVSKDTHGINLPESYENSEPKRGGLVDTTLVFSEADSNLDCAYQTWCKRLPWSFWSYKI